MAGYYVAENDHEENIQIVGRVNALHDYLCIQKYESVSIGSIAAIMGFGDLVPEGEE